MRPQRTGPAYSLSDRRWVTRPRLIRYLSDLQESGGFGATAYFPPGRIEAGRSSGTAEDGLRSRIESVAADIGESETGLALFAGEERIVAVVPPFPLDADGGIAEGVELGPIAELFNRDLLVAVVLLRLGRYAVGVVGGDRLVASKTDSRYVKSRHRAGGSSQRRFERSRERLVRELFDKTCRVFKDVVSPYADRIDYVLMGGERHTLRAFVQRCDGLRALESKTFRRVLPVDRPGQEALESAPVDIWKSRVDVFNGS